MTGDDGQRDVGHALEDKAFASIAVPARPRKPRQTGQTVVADKGLGTHAANDLLEVADDYIDWIKLASSSARLLGTRVLDDKIHHYTAHDVRVLIAGDVLELGLRNGVIEQVWDEARDRGADGIEIAAAQTSLSLGDQAVLVGKAAQRDLHVFAEVGSKRHSDARLHPPWIVRQIDTLLRAGAYRVVVQGEGVTEDVERINTDMVLAIAARTDLDRVVWQAKNATAQAWLIEALGPSINVDVESSHALMLEALRRGIRERGIFGLTATATEWEQP